MNTRPTSHLSSTSSQHVAPPPANAPAASGSKVISHHSWSPYTGPVLFTGPDGQRDQRVKVQNTEFLMVGEGDRSPEVTSEMGYLSRPPPGQGFPKSKNQQIGEIGWPVETFKLYHGI